MSDSRLCPMPQAQTSLFQGVCQPDCAWRIGDDCAMVAMAVSLQRLSALASNNRYDAFMGNLSLHLSDSVAEAARKELLARLQEMAAGRP